MIKNEQATKAIQLCQALLESPPYTKEKVADCQQAFRQASRISFNDEKRSKDESQIIYTGALARIADVLYCTDHPFSTESQREKLQQTLDYLNKEYLSVEDEEKMAQLLINRDFETTVPLDEHPLYKIII